MDSTELSMPPEVRNLMRSMWADIERTDRERITKEAEKDPEKYRNTNIIRDTNFRYYSVPGLPKGKRIGYCYSHHRNVAGFYLSWTEVWKGSNGYRENFKGWESKRDAIEYCRMRVRDAKKPKAERKFKFPDFKKAA